MLHIILTVLKIIGILLLVLVLLLAGLVLAALFVPLRYRLAAVHSQEDTHAQVSLTWLLHLISVRVLLQTPQGGISSDRKPFQIRVRILGIDPAGVSSFFRRRKKKKTGRLQKEQKENHRPKEETLSKEEALSKEETLSEEKAQRKPNGQPEPHLKELPHISEDQPAEAGQQADEKAHMAQADPSVYHKILDWLRRICRRFLNKIRTFCDTIRSIPKRFTAIKRKILKILKTPGELSRKVSDFRGKLEACEADEVVKETFSRLKQLLRHFRIRKGKGYLRFGSGDPALTGELTGLLYLILPVSCGEISIEPQFTETMLDMDLKVSGRIRLIHLVTVIWWAFRNQRLRGLIRLLRNSK
ncbi:MAG: DUF2953 domain-containing protein [Clostridiales bacterium]|nr:DUF2953 domain-containing protein [Clostridiales bacterium]